MNWWWPFQKKVKAPTALPTMIRARYDAAQTTLENLRHWAMADALSADSALSPDVRKKLRERSRYEVANNSYARGIVLTLANDCIGTGPRLQVLSDNNAISKPIETAFTQWAQAVDLASKLRTMRMAKITDGETFGLLTLNPRVDSPVMLDVQLIEAERIASPMGLYGTPAHDIDGVILDVFGNVEAYSLLASHPGDLGAYPTLAHRLSAEAMLHWYRCDRPGQHRGLPEITAALPLFAMLRRYTLAVIAAAETAADFAAVLFTDSPANGEAQPLDPMDVVNLEKRMATVLPDGWRLGQIEAQQPTTTYAEFKREILNEIARCLNLPYNVAACNSSGYNYASGRLDHQTYYKSIRVEQSHLATAVLDRIFHAWMAEAVLLPEFAAVRTMRRLPHQGFFDGTEHVDPAKEANAQAMRLANHTTTLATEYARQGKDWEVEVQQRAKEQKMMRRLGLLQVPVPLQLPSPASNDTEDQEDENDAQRNAA